VETTKRRWGVQLFVLPSGRISVRVLAGLRGSTHVFVSPARTMEMLDTFLAGFTTCEDELFLFARDGSGSQVWSTRSRWAGLYWCASLLSRVWPPPWVPVVERRGANRYAGVPPFEPPLLERRGIRPAMPARLTRA
jgi:hypothetical protein